MSNTGNMQRLQRGELTRMSPRAGKHTDVHMGAPTVVPAVTADVNTTGAEVAKLSAQVQQLQKENANLTDQLEDAQRNTDSSKLEEALKDALEKVDTLEAVQAELKSTREKMDALEMAKMELEEEIETAQAKETPDPVNGLRVVKINEVTETDDLVRLDCELRPTTGPLASEGALIIPVSEIDKLIEGMRDAG